MPLFVIFVFGAVILGAGVMLSPAWPTPQPRVMLSAAFALALIVGGTIFYSMLFGWDTLVVDYLLFALVTGIFLGGTLSIGQARAEQRGEVLADADQGWPGPQDIAFLLLVGLIVAVPVLLLPVPLGVDGQGYGYLALLAREGGTFDSFAPFHPEIEYLYSPGFSALTAYLSQQLNQDIPTVQFSVAAVLALLSVGVAYDFGAELRDKRLGRAMALTMLLSLGVYGALLAANFTALMGLVFAQAFCVYLVRYKRHGYPADAIAAGLMLGATAISHPGMTIIIGLGFVPWLATIWLAEPKPDRRTWLGMALGIPLVAALAISPWLVEIAGLLRADFASPFERSVENINVMIQYHGVWIVPAALLGAWLGWGRRDAVVILAVGWLLLILDFSTTGGLASLLPFVTRFVHPLDIAWHGPIIPYTILGGMGLLWLWDEYIRPRIGVINYRQAYVINGVLALLLMGLVTLFGSQLSGLGRALLASPGAFASAGDVAAMRWINENTSFEDTRLLNFPGPYEGDWVPVIAERDSVYFPRLPYARITAEAQAEQHRLLAFWRDPADPDHAELLREAGIDYVIVPGIVAAPDSFDDTWRWAEPTAWEVELRSPVSAAGYLELVFEQNGAQVYRLIGDEDDGDSDNADTP
jgi:hypothetical protein